MKPWAPLAYPDPVTGKHRDAVPSLNLRGSWPSGLGYQQILDELNAIRIAAGLTESASDNQQIAKSIASGRLVYGADTGAANALAIALPVAPDGYGAGLHVLVKVAVDNTGPSTIIVNGLGAKPIQIAGAELIGGELKAGRLVVLAYNGTLFEIVGGANNAAAISTAITSVLNAYSIAGGRTAVWTAGGVYYWTVPAGVRVIACDVWGGGGGGGDGYGHGGGGAGYAWGVYAVTPGDTLVITCAFGGAHNVSGGTSSVGSLISATGGGGAGGSPGAPGTGVGGQINKTSSRGGGVCVSAGGVAFGGMGGESPNGGGIGQINVGAYAVGDMGNAPGGGGNGGASPGATGGAGATGEVQIHY